MPAFDLSDTKYSLLVEYSYNIAGLSIHKYLIINFLVDRVAVAVSVIKRTLSGTMLLISSRQENSFLKLSPLT